MSSAAPHNFSWIEPKKLAGMALPRLPAHYQFLLDNGIRHLVTLCERKPPYHDTCPDLTLHHIKIDDFCPPTLEQTKRFLNVVEESNAKGEGFVLSLAVALVHGEKENVHTLVEGVAVHCLHGHGRTGTMLACYLVKKNKITGIDAINEIRRLRPGSIETHEQEKAIVQFYQHIK